MAKRSGEKRDFMQVAREVVERAIGEQMNGTPLEDPDAGKNPAARSEGDRWAGQERPLGIRCPSGSDSPSLENT